MSLSQATSALPDSQPVAQPGAASPADEIALPSAVDERIPAGKLITLGLQHVLVMYAGAIAVPLIVGRALKLPPEQVAALISADLFCCGLVTVIQSLGLGKLFGIRLPVMMGVTFAPVSPMLAMAMANDPTLAVTGIFGAVIGAGVISLLQVAVLAAAQRHFAGRCFGGAAEPVFQRPGVERASACRRPRQYPRVRMINLSLSIHA